MKKSALLQFAMSLLMFCSALTAVPVAQAAPASKIRLLYSSQSLAKTVVQINDGTYLWFEECASSNIQHDDHQIQAIDESKCRKLSNQGVPSDPRSVALFNNYFTSQYNAFAKSEASVGWKFKVLAGVAVTIDAGMGGLLGLLKFANEPDAIAVSATIGGAVVTAGATLALAGIIAYFKERSGERSFEKLNPIENLVTPEDGASQDQMDQLYQGLNDLIKFSIENYNLA